MPYSNPSLNSQNVNVLPNQNGTGNQSQQDSSNMQSLTSVMGLSSGNMNMPTMPVFNPLTNSWNTPQQTQQQTQQQQQPQTLNQNQVQGQNQGLANSQHSTGRNDNNNNNNGDDGGSFSYGGNLAHCA